MPSVLLVTGLSGDFLESAVTVLVRTSAALVVGTVSCSSGGSMPDESASSPGISSSWVTGGRLSCGIFLLFWHNILFSFLQKCCPVLWVNSPGRGRELPPCAPCNASWLTLHAFGILIPAVWDSYLGSRHVFQPQPPGRRCGEMWWILKLTMNWAHQTLIPSVSTLCSADFCPFILTKTWLTKISTPAGLAATQ